MFSSSNGPRCHSQDVFNKFSPQQSLNPCLAIFTRSNEQRCNVLLMHWSHFKMLERNIFADCLLPLPPKWRHFQNISSSAKQLWPRLQSHSSVRDISEKPNSVSVFLCVSVSYWLSDTNTSVIEVGGDEGRGGGGVFLFARTVAKITEYVCGCRCADDWERSHTLCRHDNRAASRWLIPPPTPTPLHQRCRVWTCAAHCVGRCCAVSI